MTSDEILHQYLNNVSVFGGEVSPHGGYRHIPASLTDLVLQPVWKKYGSQVKPIVVRLRDEYPQCRTSSDFVGMMEETSPKYFINIPDGQRARQIYSLAQYLVQEGIETEDEWMGWLADEPNQRAFRKQRGMTTRSVDYARLLLGDDVIPVDHAIRPLLDGLSLPGEPYEEAQTLCMDAAFRSGVSPRNWYLLCWRYWMANSWPSPSAPSQ